MSQVCDQPRRTQVCDRKFVADYKSVIESNGVNIALKLLMSYRPEVRESSLAVSSGVKLSIQERETEWLLTFTHQSGY